MSAIWGEPDVAHIVLIVAITMGVIAVGFLAKTVQGFTGRFESVGHMVTIFLITVIFSFGSLAAFIHGFELLAL